MGRILILYDNRTEKDALVPGWGFSALIEHHGRRILFDAGADRLVLEHNARVLNADFSTIDRLVLSHEHCDHIGGMLSVLRPRLEVVCPASFSRTYQRAIAKEGGALRSVTGAFEIVPGILSTGELGTTVKEQALVVEGREGPILITGCAHPGIAKVCLAAEKIVGTPLFLVLGGFHFYRSKEPEVRKLAGELAQVGMKWIAPCHCTGDRGMMILRETFGETLVDVKAGSEIGL